MYTHCSGYVTNLLSALSLLQRTLKTASQCRTYARRHQICMYVRECKNTYHRPPFDVRRHHCASKGMRARIEYASNKNIQRSNIFHEVAPRVHLQMECLLMHFFSLFYVTDMHSRRFAFRRKIVCKSNVSISTFLVAKLSPVLRKEEKRSKYEQNEQK